MNMFLPICPIALLMQHWDSIETPTIEGEEAVDVDAEAETANDALTHDNNGDLTSDVDNSGDAQPDVLLSVAKETDEGADPVTASPPSHAQQKDRKVKLPGPGMF